MTGREAFLSEIETLIELATECQEIFFEGLSPSAEKFFEDMKKKKEKNVSSNGRLTENGAKILAFMQDHYEDVANDFSASLIGDGIDLTGKSVSGSMRKLVSDRFVEKIADKPVRYGLTDEGKNFKFEN